MKHRIVLMLICLVLCTAACVQAIPTKVLFVYPNQPNDFGYAYAVELARINAERVLTSEPYNYELKTNYLVVGNTSTAVEDIAPFLNDGYSLVLFGGGQFTPIMNKLAPAYPSVKFMGTSAVPQYPNTMGVQTANYPWYFLNGLLCGLVSKTHSVAYLTVWRNHADPYLNANAFWYGAKLANPNTNVRVVSSYSYSDDVVGQYAIEELISQGVDCFAINQNTQTANAKASERGVISCGTSSDTRFLAGEHVFTSGIRNWNPRVLEIVKSHLDNDWQPYRLVSDGFNQSALHLAWWSTIATQPEYDTMRSTIEGWVTQLSSTPDQQIFCGQLATLTTGISWAADACMNQTQLLAVRSTVPGIDMGSNYTRESVTVVRYVKFRDPAAIVVVVLVCIFCAVLVATAIHLNLLGERSAYKASSPQFMMFILVGMFLISISCLFWSIKPGKLSCALRPWIAGLGWILVVSAPLAKMHRIHEIFTLRDFKTRAITNTGQILKFMAVMCAIELFILVFWQIFAPLEVARKSIPGLAYNEVYEYCKSKSDVPIAIFLALNAIALIPVLVFAWKTRTVREEYNESSAVGLSSAVTIFLGILIIGTTRLVQENIVAQYLVPTIGMLGIMIAMYVLIFVPKILYVHGIWDDTDSHHSASSKNASHTKTTSSGDAGAVKMTRRKDSLKPPSNNV